MKKLFTLALLLFVIITISASAGSYIRPQPEEYTKLFDIDITLNFPIGEIKNGKLVYTRKDVQIKGVIEVVAGYGSSNPGDRTQSNAHYR